MSVLKQSGEKFKIAQFTDLHLDYLDDNGPEQKTLKLVRDCIRDEKPDLVVITGDLVTSEASAETIKGFSDVMTELKQPWAFVFGNHDREYGAPESVLEKILTESEYCLFEPGDSDIKGSGNYCIEIKNADNRLQWALYMLDSGDYLRTDKCNGYAHIDISQINWFKNHAKNLTAKGEYSSLFFFHIPLCEYNEIWEKKLSNGEKNEGICSPVLNSGLFSAMVESGNAKGVFVGHDHTNDFAGELYGVKLCYGRGSGFGAPKRGAYGKDGYKHGARMIVLDNDCFNTYIYFEDNTVL